MWTSEEWIARCANDILYCAPEWREFRIRDWRLFPRLDVDKFDKAMHEALLAEEPAQ